MRFVVKVKPQEDRLDKFLLTQLKDTSRNKIHKLLEDGNILVNSHPVDPDYRLHKDDKIDINVPPPQASDIQPENIPLKIVYEDSDLVVIDKPAGLVVHPTSGHIRGTLVNALLYHFKNLPDSGGLRPGIVHRLDKDTSGLMVVAKNEVSFEKLKEAFANHQIQKSYYALVSGHLDPKEGTIRAKIDRHPKNPMKFAVSAEGKEAETYYKVVTEFKDFSLLTLQPKTGRTHQLRVHLEAIRHPIAGDKLYGGKMILGRQFLHAYRLRLVSPSTKKELEFSSPLPADLQAALEKLT
jgi:23S rRNA pseudouridine1911/1915/1917 synthase